MSINPTSSSDLTITSSSSSCTSSLENLPLELFIQILGNLDLKSLIQCAYVNREFSTQAFYLLSREKFFKLSCLAHAAKIVPTMGDAQKQDASYLKIIKLMVVGKDLDGAERVTKKLLGNSAKIEALNAIRIARPTVRVPYNEVLEDACMLKEYVRTKSRFPPIHAKIEALILVSRAERMLQTREEALRTLLLACETTNELDTPSQQIDALLQISEELFPLDLQTTKATLLKAVDVARKMDILPQTDNLIKISEKLLRIDSKIGMETLDLAVDNAKNPAISKPGSILRKICALQAPIDLSSAERTFLLIPQEEMQARHDACTDIYKERTKVTHPALVIEKAMQIDDPFTQCHVFIELSKSGARCAAMETLQRAKWAAAKDENAVIQSGLFLRVSIQESRHDQEVALETLQIALRAATKIENQADRLQMLLYMVKQWALIDFQTAQRIMLHFHREQPNDNSNLEEHRLLLEAQLQAILCTLKSEIKKSPESVQEGLQHLKAIVPSSSKVAGNTLENWRVYFLKEIALFETELNPHDILKIIEPFEPDQKIGILLSFSENFFIN